MKYKVVEVIPTLNIGGAESMVRDYCLKIDKEEFDICVVVLTEHKKSPIEKALENAGIEVIYLGEQLYNDDRLNYLQRVIRRISRFYYFRSVITSINPNVVHLHLQIGRYMRMLPLKKMECRLFLTVHNVPERFFSIDKNDRVKYREYKEVYRLIHSYGMSLITLHDGLNEELRRLFDTDNVTTLHNGIRMDKFDPSLYDKIEERQKLEIGLNDTVIGHVGSMHPQKNHELILSIFAEYHKLNPLSKLLLIGDGDLRDVIVRRIDVLGLGNHVIILSNRGDVPALMSTMDVFLFPSRWEGFGNVMIEAQCMNLPCVVSDAVPIETRVTDRVFVVSLDSEVDIWVRELEDALNGLIGSDIIASKDNYDMQNCVHKLEKIYRGKSGEIDDCYSVDR